MTEQSDPHLSRIRDRIAKYLRMAESTTFAHEAETFSAAAEDLMLKYGIEVAATDINTAPSAREGIIKVEREVAAGRWGGVETYFAAQIAEHGLGNVRVVQHRQMDGRRITRRLIWFYGFESDVQHGIALFDSLLIQAHTALSAWQASAEGRAHLRFLSPAGVFAARKSYLMQFAHGARQRIEANKRTVMAEAGSGSTVAIANRKSQVDHHVTTTLGKLGRSRTTAGNATAGAAGYRAGRNARTGERELAPPRAIHP